MKALVVYYSRSGNTGRVANEIAARLGADLERLHELGDRRQGPFGWLRSSIDALLRNTPALRPLEHNPADYELVVVGTPVWWGSVSAPVRSFLLARPRLPAKLALFCTCGGRGADHTLAQMARLAVRDPIATLAVREDELDRDRATARLIAMTDTLAGVTRRHDGPSRPSYA